MRNSNLQIETTDVKTMIFWSLNTRFYLAKKTDGFLMRNASSIVFTMENRWFLDDKFQIETTDVKAMIF